jgi:autotransporter-associated beta strand protein
VGFSFLWRVKNLHFQRKNTCLGRILRRNSIQLFHHSPMNSFLRLRVCKYLPLVFLIFSNAAPLSAQTTYNYDGGGTSALWSNPTNWADNTLPTFNTNAVLSFNYNFSTTNVLATGAAYTVRGLVFGANLTGASSFQIRTKAAVGGSSGNTLTLNGGSANAYIVVENITDTSLTTIQLGDNNGAIAFASNVDLTNNSAVATFLFANSVSGSGALNKYGIGTTAFNRSNSFAGGINIYEGTVQAYANASALGPGAVTLGAGNSSGNAVLAVGGAGGGTAVTYTNAITVGAGSGTRTVANINTNVTAAVGNTVLSGAMTLNKDVIFDITQYTANTHDRITNSGAVSGSGGIIKAGTGILILSNAANSFGGLQINAGQVTLQTNATVTGLSGSGGSLALSGGTFTVNASADSSFGQVISGAGNLTKSGNGTLTLSASNTVSGGVTLSAGTLRAGNDGALGTGGFTMNAGTFASDGAAARAITNAITLSGNVQLGDGTGTGALTLGSVNLGAATRTLTVSNTTTFSGAVTNGGLVKAGAGTLNLSNTATSFGALQIDAGRVAVQTNATITGLSGAGGDLALVGGTLTVNASADSSFGQVISGAGALAKSGAGTLVLSASNSYSGGTTLTAGTLRVGDNSALGTGTLAVTASSTLTSDGATARTIANAITLGSGTGNVALASGDATATGALTLSGPVTLGGTTGSRIFTVNNAPMTVSGLITSGTSTGAVVKNGTGTLLLANTANTFTNNFAIQGGTLEVTKLSDKGTASSIGTMEGAAYLQIGQNTTAATLNYVGTGDTTDLQIAIGNGDGNGGNASILNNGSGALVFDNAVFNVASSGSTARTRLLFLGGGNTDANAIQGVISDITVLNKTTRVVKNDAGTWILSGANTYTIGTTLNDGTLRVGNDNALGTGGFTINGGIFASDGATARTITNAITMGGNVQLGDATGTGALTLGGIDLGTATRTLTISNANTIVAGVMSNTGGLTKAGAGTLALASANTYSGATAVDAGTLAVTHGDALGSTTDGTTVASGAQVRLVATNSGFIVGAESLTLSGQGVTTGGALRNAAGDNTWQGNITLAANATIGAASGTSLTIDVSTGNAISAANFGVTFDGAGTNRVLDAIVLGSGGLTKIGSGKTILAASNDFTGAVQVSTGVLELASTAGGAAATTGSVSVASGATLLLSQSDQVNNAASVSLSGGTIQRGSGVSEVFGNLNLTTASFLDFGTGATGNMTFGTYQNNETPSALLTLNNFLPGNSFTFSSTSFSTNTVGTYFAFGTGYVGSSISSTGSTFTITAIPEPSTYLAAAGLLAVLLWPSRRRLLKDTKAVLGLRIPMRDRLEKGRLPGVVIKQ